MTKNYIKVDQEKGNELLNAKGNEMYKYMPVIIFRDGEMCQVVAQDNNNIYYM